MLGFYYYRNTNTNITGDATSTGYDSFNPFGTDSSPTNSANTDTVNDTDVTPFESIGATEVSQASKFHKITDFAVAGAAYFEDTRPLAEIVTTIPGDISTPPTNTKPVKTTKAAQPKFETVPSIRYVERTTGHIYQMYLDTKVPSKISNSTVPAIYETIFDSRAATIIYRYLGDDGFTINSFMATLGATKGEFLSQNIIDMSLSPDKSKFFYLTKTTSGVVGTTRTFGETKSTQVFNSSFSEWLSQWIGNQKVYLTTKAAAGVEGSLFNLNTATGSMTKVFGGVAGLTTLANKEGSLVLYSSSTGTEPRLGIFTVGNRETLTLNISSLPEKCVWGAGNIFIYCAVPDSIPSGKYPDAWYQGRVSFNDHFVKINAETGDIYTVTDSSGEPVDGTHLFLNKTENQIFFINKKDSTLWSLDI